MIDFDEVLLEPVAEYELSRDEVRRGCIGGFRRWNNSKELKNAAGYEPTPWEDMKSATIGAVAEVAAAKWLGIPFCELKIHEGQFKTKPPDLPPDFEVRSTERGGLVIRPHEVFRFEGRRLILVTNDHPSLFRIWGWAHQHEVVLDGTRCFPDPKRNKNPVWMLPRHRLNRKKP